MTPHALIAWAAGCFRAAQVPDPDMDAACLLAYVTGQQALMLRADRWSEVSQTDTARFRALCQQRCQRIPLQYLLKDQPFCGHSFYVDERVLIPRPETELLAERAMAALKAYGPEASALDLCCGSGCIAVSLALAVPLAQVHACDLSQQALAVARRNCEALNARVTLHQGNLFKAVSALRFHVIVSNPPYIPTQTCQGLQQEVLREPLMALDGGRDGLDFYRRIAKEGQHHLYSGGTLLLEVGFDQAAAVSGLLRSTGWKELAVHEDYQHIPRMVEAHL